VIEDVLTICLGGIRGADSNSLLRMYDVAGGFSDRAPSQHDHVQANRAVRRIAQELDKRHVPFEAAT
jgi:hypothetical protein